MTLPTFDGDKDKTLGRVMLAAVDGPDGIRTRISSNAFGSKTMLRTRNGMPEFTTVRAQEGTDASRRGFVAYVRGSRYGALFDPYTLEVLDPKYRLVGALYSVQDFATGWNVSPTDTTHWCDTIVFDGEVVKVNAKAMTLINSPSGGAFGTIPFLRKASDTEPYGNRVLNATQKRVFAVGRETVQAWGGSGAVQTLTPTAPRAEDKAMTIGQRVDPASSKAWLGQLFYSGWSWDDLGGEWGFSSAEVAMMLTPPYLSKVSTGMVAAMPIVSFGDPVSSSGSMDTSTTLPATPVAMTASGYISQLSPYGTGACTATMHWDWSGTVSKALDGYVHANYGRSSYAGEKEDSSTQGGYSVVYSGNNVKNFDLRSDITYISAQTVPICDTHTDSLTSATLGATNTTLYWDANSSYNTPESVPPTRGVTSIYISGGSNWTGGVPRNYETQNATFSVTANGSEILYCAYHREHSTGQKEVFHPNTTEYDIYIGNYTYSGPSGMGMLGKIFLQPKVWAGSDTIEIQAWYKINPTPPPYQLPEVEAEVTQELQDMANALAGQTYYDNESTSGVYRHNYYTRTIDNDITQDTRSLTWRTKDYLLHDVTNGVYISVEGSFYGSGHPATATLGVSLKVQTRYNTNSISFGGWNYSYGELLPEKILDEDLGLWAVPSPQIRAIFAPLYQEQGSFKGAHYVTAAEEANGALPFHGFNFVLVLQPYDAVSSCNDDNLGTHVFMVPCNLLEMLYAFVFSQEYGVSQYERYPVSFLQRYTDIMSGASALFNVSRRVQIRDGVVSNWVGNLGTAYANSPTTELYRT